MRRRKFSQVVLTIPLSILLCVSVLGASSAQEDTPTPTATPAEPTASSLPADPDVTATPTAEPTEDESAILPPAFEAGSPEPVFRSFQAFGPQGSSSDVLLAGGDALQSSSALAYDPLNRRYLVVWRDDGPPSSLHGRFISEASLPLTEEFLITGQIVATPVRPELVYNSTDHSYLLVWSERNGTTLGAPFFSQPGHNLYALQLANDGHAVPGAPTVITNQVTFFIEQDIRAAYALTYNSAANEFVAAWTQPPQSVIGNIRHPHRILAQRIGPDAGLRGAKVTVKTGVEASIGLAYSPTSNEYLLTWDRFFSGPTGYELFASRLQPASLVQTGSDIPVGGGAGWQGFAALAYAPSTNDYFVTWMSGPNPPAGQVLVADIAGRRVHAGTGALVGPLTFILQDQEPIYGNDVVYSPIEDRFLVIAKVAFSRLTGRYVTVTGEMLEDPFSITDMPLDVGPGPHDDLPRIGVRTGPADGAPAWVTTWKSADDIYVRAITDGCDPNSLSTLGQIALAQIPEDEPQQFCKNQFDGLTFIEDEASAEAAFEQMAELISRAEHEVDLTTMIWDEDAGDILMGGLLKLYLQQFAFPNGMHVRILLGTESYLFGDQRRIVLQSMDDLGIPLEAPNINWKVEVASHRNAHPGGGYQPPNTHSHVKLLIIDGQEAIVGGYNVQDIYLDSPTQDVGIAISGPIVQESLRIFDELWYDARGLSCLALNGCEYRTEPQGQIPHAPEVLQSVPVLGEPVNVLSLFRDENVKTADDAIVEVIRAASVNVDILQERYFENYPRDKYCLGDWCVAENWEPDSFPPGQNGPMPYTQAVIDAAANGTQVRMILASGIDSRSNEKSVDHLRKQILALPNGTDILPNITVKFVKLGPIPSPNPDLHAKSVSVDGQFLVVGSQNFDYSAFGEDKNDINDLPEYSFGVDNPAVALKFEDDIFGVIWSSDDAEDYAVVNDSIQQTIDQAEPGTIVSIPAGNYRESLIINKPLTLIGDSESYPVIESVSGTQPAIQITSSGVSLLNLVLRSNGYGVVLRDISPSSLLGISVSRIVFEQNALGGILLEGLIPGSPIQYTIENNTFVGGGSGITLNTLETQPTLSLIRNNIFIGQSSAPIRILSAGDGGVDYRYNLFSACGSSPDCSSAWHSGSLSPASVAEHNLYDLDPLYMNPRSGDYHLSPASPLIDAGDPTTVLFEEYPNAPAQIDIGAFETFFTLEQLPPLADDAPDFPGFVSELTPANSNLRYFLNPSGDEDWFRFRLASPGSPQVHLNSLPADYDLYVYNAAGQLMGTSNKDKKAAELVTLGNVPPGNYYVRIVGVDGAWDADNSYQLRFNVPGTGGP